ncbi:MAG: methyltransferase domain-containing protein [Nanoarchaeota archaeon]|nr:methyltransferase domain-containing protein [Nanoarchaeota archaeon]
MKKELLKYLVCPYTKEELILSNEILDNNNEVVKGELISVKSKKKYFIKNYVPIMMLNTKTQKKFKDWEQEWLDKDFEFNLEKGDTGASKRIFEMDYKTNEFDFGNDLILEAGCGGGRITSMIYRKEVKNYFCMDISNAIYEAREKHKDKQNIHFIKGDLSNPPFKKNSLNKIFLIGVLQHTKNPYKSVEVLSYILKKEGYFFGGNYLLPENFFVRYRFYFTEFLRFLFRNLRVSSKFVKSFTKISIYARKFIFLRPLQWIFFNNTIPKNYSDKYLWLINYDYYNPNIYQHMYTREETKNIFLRSGLYPILESKSVPNSYVFKKGI